MSTRFYVTTPIYYVNDSPHLGTSYTTIAADALRRYHLVRGHEARMLTGTDEHGLKLEREATDRGMTPRAFVDEMSQRFRKTWPELGVEADDFIRTTEERHTLVVQDLWRKIEARGDLYLGEYEDWYCVGCESFKTEKELLPGNVCPHHGKPVEKVKEETYFFRLSKYEKPLLAHYAKHPEFIEPHTRRNEVISFVSGGLRDLSVSRTSFKWGVPVPGNPRHIMYVWFDALTNYYSALGGDDDPLRRFWPPNGRVVHLVGKDILRFHAVYWPAFLLAAGFEEDELPTQVFAHGFLTADGQKMSKSLRNAIDPVKLAHALGSDVLRYQLLRAIAFGQDGDFDHAAMIERYNADLGKNLGNLLARTLGLCAKMTDNKTPDIGTRTDLERDLVSEAQLAYRQAAGEWDATAPHRALEVTWTICAAANQYVDRAAPWAEAKKGNTARVGTILATLLELLRAVSIMIWPVLPKKSDELRAQLGLPKVDPKLDVDLWPLSFEPRPAGEALAPGAPLFPTLDKDAEAALLDKLLPKASLGESGDVPVTTQAGAPPEIAPLSRKVTEPPPSAPPTPLLVSYDQFASLDIRVGLVKSCERVPKKDKLLKLMVDLGEHEPRPIIAGLALTFAPEALVGKRVLVIANLAPRDFGRGLVSCGMILATGPSEALHLATVDEDVAPGSRLK